MVDELLQEARRGNRGAISILLNRHSGALSAWAVREIRHRTGRQIDPSALIEETLRRAQDQFGEFRGLSGVDWSKWLQLLLRDTIAETLEQDPMARAQLDEDEARTEVMQRVPKGLRSGGLGERSSGYANAKDQQGERFDSALASLPAVQANVVRLRQVHQWTLRRMAEHLGLDEATIAGQLRQGLSRVRQAIESQRAGEP